MWAPWSALSAARPPKQCISVLFFSSVTRLEPRLYLRYPTLLYIVRYFMYIQCIRHAATRGLTPRAVLESLQVVVSRCCPPCGSKTHDARLLPWYSFAMVQLQEQFQVAILPQLSETVQICFKRFQELAICRRKHRACGQVAVHCLRYFSNQTETTLAGGDCTLRAPTTTAVDSDYLHSLLFCHRIV